MLLLYEKWLYLVEELLSFLFMGNQNRTTTISFLLENDDFGDQDRCIYGDQASLSGVATIAPDLVSHLISIPAVEAQSADGWQRQIDGSLETMGTTSWVNNATVSYTFVVPSEGRYKVYAYVRWDGIRGALKYRIDSGEWSSGTMPLYGRAGQSEPHRYGRLLLGESYLSRGNHTVDLISYRSPGFIGSQNIANIFLIESGNGSGLGNVTQRYEKMNPTKYIVHTHAQAPFFLVLGETYDAGWTAYLDGQETSLNHHLMVDYYANAWYISATGVHDILVEYRPQRVFYIGAFVSAVCGTLCVALIVIRRTRPLWDHNGSPRIQAEDQSSSSLAIGELGEMGFQGDLSRPDWRYDGPHYPP